MATLFQDTAADLRMSLPGIFVLFLVLGPSVASLVYSHCYYGKQVTVTFIQESIRIEGKVTGRFPVLDDQITFCMRPHEKIRMHRRVNSDEAEKLQDYGEIIMEYGLQTYPVCNIANLQKAQLFTRVLNEAYKRSRSKKPVPQVAPRPNVVSVDPDSLPE